MEDARKFGFETRQVHAGQRRQLGRELRQRAAHMVAPAAAGEMRRLGAEREAVIGLLLVERQRVHLTVIARSGGDPGVAVDGHRQHEAIVVIGVFADQVDPAGRAREHRRRGAVALGEGTHDGERGGREVGGGRGHGRRWQAGTPINRGDSVVSAGLKGAVVAAPGGFSAGGSGWTAARAAARRPARA